MKVVIILPTYNEKENVEKVISVLEEEIFPTLKTHKMAILVADDNSPDGTADEVRKLMKKWKNIEIVSGERRGLGAAYVRGMSYAIEKMDADVMFEMDADGQHDPTRIPEFLKKIDAGYDFVVGTRYSQGGSIPRNWPPQRKAFSVIANLLVRTIFMRFYIHDWTGGYRALKKEVFLKEKQELINYNGYIFQISFLHKVARDGFKIGEVPFHFTDRTLGKSKIAPLGYIFDVLSFVITTRFREIITGSFGKFLVVGGFGFIIDLVIYSLLVEGAKVEPANASLISAVFAMFSNYNLNNLWTFRAQQVTSVGGYFYKLLQFYLSSSFGVIVIRYGLILLGDKLIGRQYHFVYFLFGTGLMLIWNFTMYRFVIWRKKAKIR